MIYGQALRISLAAAIASLGVMPSTVHAASKANLSGVNDVNFGVIGAFTDQTVSQNICVFAQNFTGGYSVIASGDGTSGAFSLSSGMSALPYEVMWNSSAGQVGGMPLNSGAASPGFSSEATQKTCNTGPSSSASLIIAIRASALNNARAGTYSGTLQLTIVPD